MIESFIRALVYLKDNQKIVYKYNELSFKLQFTINQVIFHSV